MGLAKSVERKYKRKNELIASVTNQTTYEAIGCVRRALMRGVLYQPSTGFADPREMKPCPIHRALLARWVGDHNGQPSGKSPCCFFLVLQLYLLRDATIRACRPRNLGRFSGG